MRDAITAPSIQPETLAGRRMSKNNQAGGPQIGRIKGILPRKRGHWQRFAVSAAVVSTRNADTAAITHVNHNSRLLRHPEIPRKRMKSILSTRKSVEHHFRPST